MPFIDVVNELLVEKIRLNSQPQANIALQFQGISSLNVYSEKLIIDISVTNHMSDHLPFFLSLSPNSSMSISTANGESVPVSIWYWYHCHTIFLFV